MFYLLLVDVIVAYLLDMILGDPHWLPHPVRLIGGLIKGTESFLRKIESMMSSHKVKLAWGGTHIEKVTTRKNEKIIGVFLPILVVSLVFIVVFAILRVASILHPIAFHVINIYILYTSFAAKCLGRESYKVFDAIKDGDLWEAKKRLSMLVGRDTESMNNQDIIRATVETTAENTVDGVISPLFYAIIGSVFGIGAPLVYAYKAINTLDSMVGYTNDRYINFGFASAKLDDAANFIPARITGVLIPFSTLFLRLSFTRSFTIMIRDRRKHKSPNSAYPEAAVAGALGVKLGGANVYFGNVVEKPTIGDYVRELRMKDILDTINMMYITSVLALGVFEGLALIPMIYIY